MQGWQSYNKVQQIQQLRANNTGAPCVLQAPATAATAAGRHGNAMQVPETAARLARRRSPTVAAGRRSRGRQQAGAGRRRRLDRGFVDAAASSLVVVVDQR